MNEKNATVNEPVAKKVQIIVQTDIHLVQR